MQSENIFKGTFKIVSLYGFVQDKGWILIKRYGRENFIWEFEEHKRLVLPSEIVVYGGILKEQSTHYPREETEFSYFPADHQLYIDRSDYASDGFCNICINERYRVEHIRNNEYWLYDLGNVESDPEDYRFRIKVKVMQ